MATSRQVSELLKQVGEDTGWETAVWNEAYEENTIMQTTETYRFNGNSNSYAVAIPQEQSGIGIQTIEDWRYVKNDHQSKDDSNKNLSTNGKMCQPACAVRRYADEGGEWSDEGMQDQINDLTRKRHMLTNRSLELRFNSLQEDYLYFLRSLISVQLLDCPQSPRLASVSEREKELDHDNHHYGENIDFRTLPRIGKPPMLPTTTNGGAGGCRSTGDVESNHRTLVSRIEDEDQSLKELLGDVLIRNQLQANTIHNLNHRLEELESKLELRNRRNPGKDQARHSRASSKSKLRNRRGTLRPPICVATGRLFP